MDAALVNSMTILLVGKSTTRRQAMQNALLQSSQRILVADDHTSCLNYFEQERPELVIIDLIDPVSDEPYETCRKLRGLLSGHDAIIVGLLREDDLEALNQALEAGIDDCIDSGINPLLLLRRIETLLTASQGRIGQNAVIATRQQAEAKYRNLFNSSSDAIFITDMVTGKFLDVNRAAVKWLGYERDEMLSMRYTDIEVSLGDNGVRSFDELSSKGHFIFEQGYRAKDDSVQAAEVSSKLIKYDGRRAVINIARDISRRKAAEQAERQQRMLSEALRDTAAMLTSTLKLDEVIERILDQVTHVVPCDSANIMLVENGIQARIIGFRGYDESAEHAISGAWKIDELENLSWIVAHSQPLAIPDTHSSELWTLVPQLKWIRSYVGAPIIADGEIIGFVNLDHSVPYSFNDADAERLMAFADQASIAIQNARLHEAVKSHAKTMESSVEQRTRDLVKANLELKEQIVERRRIEEELASERNLLRTLIDNIPDEIYVKDHESKIILANRALNQRMGHLAPGGKIIGATDFDLTNGDMTPEIAELNFRSEQSLMESGESILNQEFRVTDEYGNPVWLLTTKAPIRDGQGGVMGLVGINRNVTEIKRAEERLTHIITGASCLLWYAVVEEHGEQYSWDIFVSDEQAAQRFLPLDLGSRQTYAEAWQSNVHPDDRITMDALSAEKISSVADGYNQDYRCYRNDSEIRWLHEVVQIKQLTPGRYVLVGVCTDVTDSKLASETLQRANEMLEQRVEERTADLQQEIGERIRAEQAERDQRMLAEALADVSLAISETLDIDETLDRILTHTAQTVPSFTAAGVMLIEDDAYVRFLRYRVQKDGHIENAEGQKRFAINDMPELQQILVNDEPVVVNDTRNKVIWIGKQAGVGEINSFIGIPIHAEGKIIGFLTIGSDNPNQFNKAHANRLLAFSNQAGVAIQNARLFREAQSLAGDLQKRVEERTAELDNERAQLHTILDAMTEGVIYYDVDGKIRYINRSLIQLTGYDADDWLSAQDRWPENLLDEANQRNITQSIQRTLFKDGIWQTDLQLNRKDGERIDVKLVMTLVTGFDGNSAGAVTVLRDVSADKRLEAQKARFIATASHELRTPLTNLKTRLYLLNKQPERINDHLDVIVSETDRMKFLVDELLDVSRFEHGLINLNYEDFVLQDLIRLILRVQFPRAEEKSINLQESLPETPLTISADRLRIEQVITNLITNAISYTPENGEVAVTVTVEEQNEIGKRFAAIQVRDTGIGIPVDVLPDIFQPFFRVNDFQSGMGLGLSISKEIVEMHGGKITVESEINMGACFTVYLQLDVERDS